MKKRRIKHSIHLLSLLLLILSFVFLKEKLLLTFDSSSAQATTESLEWEISALCLPHAEVVHPANLSVRFMPMTTLAGPQLTASLSMDEAYQRISLENRFGLPEEGWISSRFEGPKVEAHYFCQQTSPTKNLHISYTPHIDVQVSLNKENNWEMMELDKMQASSQKTAIEVKQNGPESESYVAGEGSLQPYWLTFSMPVHSIGLFTTTLRYEIQ